MSAIRPRQRACDTASGSGECARSRAPIVSGWRSSAAPAFRAFDCWRARVEGIWGLARAQPRIIPIPFDKSRVLPVRGDDSGRRAAASRLASRFLFLESALDVDERARLGREPQPHEKHITRRAWSVRVGRGRVGAPAMPWASSQASSQVVCIACRQRVSSRYDCERAAGYQRVSILVGFLFLLI